MVVAKIIDNLYLGDKKCAKSLKFLDEHKIKTILNCTPEPNPKNKYNIEQVVIPIHDNPASWNNDLMYGYFPEAVKFIKKHIENEENVLVHCFAGIQRSATIVTAFLMYYDKLTLDEAITYLLNVKPDVFYGGRSVHFLEALKKWETHLFY